jgi:putative glutamine amidotransferase
MRRPRIGIPLGLDDRGRWRPGRQYLYIDQGYATAITRAGGLAIHLPIQESVEALVDDLDGLMIPGGDDLPPDPALDGTHDVHFDPDTDLDLVPARQLAFDRELLETAIRKARPILGICYGMQLLARVGGGQLDTHLPSQCPEADDHKLALADGRHAIAIEADSRLAGVLATTACVVNSLHHQAVRTVGPRHRVSARSPDGIVEAIEAKHPGDPFEIGVQWHPEKLDERESHWLFESFVRACRPQSDRSDAPPRTSSGPEHG